MRKRNSLEKWVSSYMAMFTAMCVFAVAIVRMWF